MAHIFYRVIEAGECLASIVEVPVGNTAISDLYRANISTSLIAYTVNEHFV